MDILGLMGASQKRYIVRSEQDEVDFSSMLEFSAETSTQLPSEPIEQGSFATYNRVIEPVIIRAKLATMGQSDLLQSKLDELKEMASGNKKITVVTPEQKYPNMMLESFDYRRDNNSGVGLLTVELRLKEVREVATAKTTTAIEEADTEDASCVDDEDIGEQQGQAASGAEEEAASGRKTSILHDIFS